MAFKTERGKVHTGRGAVIGQFYFEGEQVKGEVGADMGEVVSAAERDASDRINRDRVPRQYQQAVKKYFSTMKGSIERAQQKQVPGTGSSKQATPEEAKPPEPDGGD